MFVTGHQQALYARAWPKGWLWPGSPTPAVVVAVPPLLGLIVQPVVLRDFPTSILVPIATRGDGIPPVRGYIITPPPPLILGLAPVLRDIATRGSGIPPLGSLLIVEGRQFIVTPSALLRWIVTEAVVAVPPLLGLFVRPVALQDLPASILVPIATRGVGIPPIGTTLIVSGEQAVRFLQSLLGGPVLTPAVVAVPPLGSQLIVQSQDDRMFIVQSTIRGVIITEVVPTAALKKEWRKQQSWHRHWGEN